MEGKSKIKCIGFLNNKLNLGTLELIRFEVLIMLYYLMIVYM